jgi:hypothetical protein
MSMDEYFAILCRRVGWLIFGCMTLVVVAAGCQGLSSPSLIPGLAESRRERQIVRQAENDPFPSPSDVGILK